jgi:formylglycine-generating enzyme required for sulfatase activity
MANRSMRPSARSFEEPGYAYNNLGFRLVRNP